MNNYRTPYDDKPYQAPKTKRRYATTAIVLGGAFVGATALSSVNAGYNEANYGTAFNYGGRQYYVPGDSKRAIYPSQQACMMDVPADRRSECEPTSSYNNAAAYTRGSWYGPVYHPRDSYQPNATYPTEVATSANIGKKLPKSGNSYGFGSNGKAFTGSKGS